jgi:hypothetical protein
MFSVSMRTASLLPKKNIILKSAGAPNCRGSLKKYCAPLNNRTPKGRNGWRLASRFNSTDLIAAILYSQAGTVSRNSASQQTACGMQFMDDVIWELFPQGVVLAHEVFMKAIDKNRFKPFLPAQFRMTRKTFPVISLNLCERALRGGEEPPITRISLAAQRSFAHLSKSA